MNAVIGGAELGLSNNIYEYRSRMGLSQGDLADRMDISRQSISKWENGSAVPELDKLVKLSELFEITLDELVHGDGPKQEEAAPADKSQSEPASASSIIAPNAAPDHNARSTTQLVIGALLIVIGAVSTYLFTSIPLFAGIGCIASKKIPVLASIWGLFLGFDLWFRSANGNHWRTIRMTSIWSPERNLTILWIAWALFTVGIALIVITAIVLARKNKYPLPINKDGTADVKRIVIFIVVLVIVYIMLFRIPYLKIFGVDIYGEITWAMSAKITFTQYGVDTVAVILFTAWLARAFSWLSQLIRRKKQKNDPAV